VDLGRYDLPPGASGAVAAPQPREHAWTDRIRSVTRVLARAFRPGSRPPIAGLAPGAFFDPARRLQRRTATISGATWVS